jgi:hypothetical protein
MYHGGIGKAAQRQNINTDNIFEYTHIKRPHAKGSPIFSDTFSMRTLVLSIRIFLPDVSSRVRFVKPYP